ncbi:MAG: hypothetical protein H6Q90_4336 [Deltaproteobacteria bacterium]|nr:hypothetical protein [Deltaproteobacteria bacterium]
MTELGHLDDEGRPCARHGAASLDAILHLAAIGSRVAGFNHDLASKLQGLMMALDEIAELSPADTDIARAAELAHAVSKELNKLLASNRALAKPPVRAPIALTELATHASARSGVTLQGKLPDAQLELPVPLVTHALALVLDAAAGPGRSRMLDVTAQLAGACVELRVTAPILASDANASLALASWVFAREGGQLRCDGECVIVRLPIVT